MLDGAVGGLHVEEVGSSEIERMKRRTLIARAGGEANWCCRPGRVVSPARRRNRLQPLPAAAAAQGVATCTAA